MVGSKNEPEQRECEICGKYFCTANCLRKYCDDCSQHTAARRREYDRALRESRARMQEENILELQCAQCGKSFRTIHKLIIRIKVLGGPDLIFCSPKCKRTYERDRAACRYCGDPLKDMPVTEERWTVDYCSAECMEKDRWRIAEKTGNVGCCENCGKRYIKGGQYFCSMACMREAIGKGWRSPKLTERWDGEPDRKKTVTRIEECLFCGKQEERSYPLPLPGFFPDHFCSDGCRARYEKAQAMEQESVTDMIRAKGRQREAFLKRKKGMEETPGAAQKEPGPAKQLCSDCQVSYKDCERMSSGFRVIPKGAHYDSNGILVECPRYISPEMKKKMREEARKSKGGS